MPGQKAPFLSKACFTDSILCVYLSICLLEASLQFLLFHLLLLLVIIPLCTALNHFQNFFTPLPRFVLTPSRWSRSGRYYDPFLPLWQPQTLTWCHNHWDGWEVLTSEELLSWGSNPFVYLSLQHENNPHTYSASVFPASAAHALVNRPYRPDEGMWASFPSQLSLSVGLGRHQCTPALNAESENFTLTWLHREGFDYLNNSILPH